VPCSQDKIGVIHQLTDRGQQVAAKAKGRNRDPDKVPAKDEDQPRSPRPLSTSFRCPPSCSPSCSLLLPCSPTWPAAGATTVAAGRNHKAANGGLVNALDDGVHLSEINYQTIRYPPVEHCMLQKVRVPDVCSVLLVRDSYPTAAR